MEIMFSYKHLALIKGIYFRNWYLHGANLYLICLVIKYICDLKINS